MMRESPLPSSAAVACALSLLACSRAEPAPAGPAIFGGQGAKIAEPSEKPLPQETGPAESGPCAAGSPKSDFALLDDFEDGDHKIFKAFEREGWWFGASDDTEGSTLYPTGDLKADLLPDATKENRFAAHFKARGQTSWGAVWGTTLRWTNRGIRCALNASAFTGIKFRAKGPATVRVNFGIPETLPADGGGKCTQGCYDNPGKVFFLSDRWEEYSVRWDRLQQGGWGTEARFDPSRLLSLNFAVDPKALPVEFWLDDVEFTSGDAGATAAK